ncbi:MAG: chromosomal replication initiator protein DnaA [Parcubacteria group bacterium Athens0714_16]|nr:MAG: chromosomal replication initiator protein DnaA [Parcubacteria group bacterium Athens0714_16]
MNTKQLWENVLTEIELGVSKASFNTWFKDTHIIKEDSGVIFVGVPNEFVKSWLSEKYHKTILKSLRNIVQTVRSVEYVVAKDKTNKKESDGQNIINIEMGNKLPLGNLYINKDDNLNPRYTFESFVVGPFNELAYAAAQAVIKNPGTVYNPLFLYGKTGHGKTHLIQAVGNEIKKNRPNAKVFYLTSEKFVIDYLNSVQNNKANAFKEKYRKYDVLIMDDIQFLSNKEKTQEELFHLFNTLYENNKQIVFSSDMHPNYLTNMEDRLKSRFNAGMIVDIPAPDHESRVAILKTKIAQENFYLSDETIDFLASSMDTNIRELEGALNTIMCQSRIKEKEPTISEIKNLIRNNMRSKRIVPIKDIVKIVTDFYNIDEATIYEKTRKKDVVKPRQIIMYILREDFSIPYPTIGQKLGGRDHTTVIHSYEKIKKDLKTDSFLSQEINQIRSMI